MNLETAKMVIYQETDAKIGRLAIATNVIASPENDEHTTLADLLACLERGNTLARINVVIEVAALTLHRRTNRKRQQADMYENLITDVADWRSYLVENGLSAI